VRQASCGERRYSSALGAGVNTAVSAGSAAVSAQAFAPPVGGRPRRTRTCHQQGRRRPHRAARPQQTILESPAGRQPLPQTGIHRPREIEAPRGGCSISSREETTCAENVPSRSKMR
jgi:hypothetical protein